MAKAMENRETSEAPRPERGTRTVREGLKPHGGRARSGGVGPRHTIEEPTEQRRGIFGGGWGEKGAGQGEHLFNSTPTRHSAGYACPRDSAMWASHNVPRSFSKVGAVCVNALVRICAGGDQ